MIEFIVIFGIISLYIMVAFFIMAIVQLISYRVFKFNLYKWLENKILK